jgi:hypothetical protein
MDNTNTKGRHMTYVVKAGHKGQYKLTQSGVFSRSIERARQFPTATEAQAAADEVNKATPQTAAYVFNRTTRQRIVGI